LHQEFKQLVTKHVFALLASLSGSIANASDWQYAGLVKAGGVQAHQFFDADSVSQPTKDVTRVWVKSIRVRDFDLYYKTHEKSVVERSVRKIADGYSPIFLALQEVKAQYADATALANASTTLTAHEVAANTFDIQAFQRFYVEIDCVGKHIRLLQRISYKEDPNVPRAAARPNSDYAFIPPDSNGKWLSLMVCHTK